MKKKFLSTLLMGALFIASVSVFTSCKDYDDDINKLNQELTSLKSSLEKRVSDLEAAKTECVTNLEKLTGRVGTLETQMTTKWGETEVKNAITAALLGYVTKADLDKALEGYATKADIKDFLTADQIKALDDKILKDAKEYVDVEAAKHAEAAKVAAIEEAKKYADELIAGLADKYVDQATYAAKMQDLDGKIAGIEEKLAKLDIDAITATIAAVENMNTQIAALESFKATMEAKTLVELKDLTALETKLNTEISNLEKKLEGDYKKAIADAVQELRDEIAEQGGIKPYDDKELREKIAGLEARILAIEQKPADFTAEEIAALKELMDNINKEVIDNLKGSADNLNVLQLFINKLVTSIVLKPQIYYSGIEAVELPNLYDKEYTVSSPLKVTRDANDQVVWPQTETWARGNYVDVCKGGIAYYHVNPYSADWENGKIEFLGSLAETRGGNPEKNYENLIKPVNSTLTKENNAVKDFAGLIKVPFTGDFDYINNLLKSNNLPMVSLKFTKPTEDKTVEVNSDWALVAPTQYLKLIIANNPEVTKYYVKTPHEGFNFDQTKDDEIATLGKITRDNYGLETSRVNPTTGHFTRLIEDITADSIPGTYQVKYDETFNLTKAVQTHYYYQVLNGAGVWEEKEADKLMTEDMFKQFGLRYEFDVVSYKLGKNKTDESLHVYLETNDKNEVVAWFPQVSQDASEATTREDGWIDEDGNLCKESGKKPAVANRSSVGRMPVVRVTILDETNKVVSYAYIKLEIVEDEVIDQPEEVSFDMSDIYVDCKDLYADSLTWSQIENVILNKTLNVSHETFETKWTLKGYTEVIRKAQFDEPDGEAFQYEKTDETTQLPTKTKDKIGKVQLKGDPKAGVHTTVLKWTIFQTEIYDNFMLKDEKGDLIWTSGTALKKDPKTGVETMVPVNYVSVDPAKVDLATGTNKVPLVTYVLLDGPKKVWVKLTIPVGKIHFAIGSIQKQKNLSYWYDLNAKWNADVNAMQGKKDPKYFELKANVTVPNTQKDNCDTFEFDVLTGFYNKIVNGTVTDAKHFPSFVDAPVVFTFTTPAEAKKNAEFTAKSDGTWEVFGNSGATYTLRVGDNRTCVIAVKKNNGALTPVDTVCAFKEDHLNVIAYKNNLTAKDILNYASHKQTETKETFTAYVKMTIAACYEMIINDGSDYFNVKFLRPVDATTKNKDVEDATDGGSVINVMDLVSFNDWRDQLFTSTNGITDKNAAEDGSQQPGVTYVKYDTPHYINYYGVQVAVDTTKARSDIKLDETQRVAIDLDKVKEIEKLDLLKVAVPDARFFFNFADVTYDATAKKLVGGTIYYENILGNINLCHIYVPVMYRYKWGGPEAVTAPLVDGYKFENWINCGYARITVKKTLSNAKKF